MVSLGWKAVSQPGRNTAWGRGLCACCGGRWGTIDVEWHGMGLGWILTWSFSLLSMSVQGQSCQGSALEGGEPRLGPQKPSGPAGHYTALAALGFHAFITPPHPHLLPAPSPSCHFHDRKWNYCFYNSLFSPELRSMCTGLGKIRWI